MDNLLGSVKVSGMLDGDDTDDLVSMFRTGLELGNAGYKHILYVDEVWIVAGTEQIELTEDDIDGILDLARDDVDDTIYGLQDGYAVKVFI